MSHTSISDEQSKEVLKEAIFEALQERKEWFSDLFAEVIEDFSLVKAIREGEVEEPATREEVFAILQGEPCR